MIQNVILVRSVKLPVVLAAVERARGEQEHFGQREPKCAACDRRRRERERVRQREAI
jgi:hypothetical protein